MFYVHLNTHAHTQFDFKNSIIDTLHIRSLPLVCVCECLCIDGCGCTHIYFILTVQHTYCNLLFLLACHRSTTLVTLASRLARKHACMPILISLHRCHINNFSSAFTQLHFKKWWKYSLCTSNAKNTNTLCACNSVFYTSVVVCVCE